MLVKDPSMVLLDEATSALDAETEDLVAKAIQESLQGLTSVIVAHRLSTIQNADQIYVMHEGKLVEQGTHDQLMANGGHYNKLYAGSQ